MFAEPHDLDLAIYDPARLRSIIELGIAQHPDPAALADRLRAGCEFAARRTDDDRVDILLVLTDRAEQIAQMRADTTGVATARLTPETLAQPFTLIRVHASALGQPPQG